jgi:Flp pilus assembly protein TadG
MKADRGSVTIWMLGLSVLLLLFGGLSVDFWRALALQRELAAVADSAAVATASGIDEEHYRFTGEIVLERHRVRALTDSSIGSQGLDLDVVDVQLSTDLLEVTVTVGDALELGLLGVFVDQTEPLFVRAESTATPRLFP